MRVIPHQKFFERKLSGISFDADCVEKVENRNELRKRKIVSHCIGSTKFFGRCSKSVILGFRGLFQHNNAESSL
jgi:hypothetical protein